jgi:2-amino-4-hydroxy-6-hydroxymethyldihydropteridine diphosphokinase
MPMRTTAIALGSNDGDRAANLDYAVRRLRETLNHVRVSAYIESDPAPPSDPSDPPYLNAVVVAETEFDARGVLDRLLEIEQARGRTRPRAGAPRTLDLDLVLLGDLVLNETGLDVPHPRFRERRFVLEPLAGLSPDLVDPVTGLTVAELLCRLR